MAEYTFSREMKRLKRSVMRDLLALAVDPSIISFAGGLPTSELLPIAQFQDCMETVLSRDGAAALQYSPMYRPLQEWIQRYMQTRQVACEVDQIFITNGAQQGQALLSRLFLDPGDVAVTEEITFTGIQQVTAGRDMLACTVPTDLKTGVDIGALRNAFESEPRPKLAVLIPDFHNPLGVSISLKKRKTIAELAARHHIPVIEDDPYSPLRFKGEPIPPIKAFDTTDAVFYLGSFSKMLAPAVRLGWIVVPTDLLPRVTVLRESFDLETSTLIQRTVAEFLTRGLLEPHLEDLARMNRERCACMQESLEKTLGDVATWTEPEGGLFIWVTLPEEMDTMALFHDALEQTVIYIPGGAFAVVGGHENTMRLNFSNVTLEDIEEGIQRLAGVIRRSLST